jgi:TrmH family RNA methyltransferase
LHRTAGRRRAARFLAEGPNLVEAASRRGLVLDVLVTESARDRYADLLDGLAVHVVTDKAAKALSDTVTPVGLVAVCTIPEVALADVLGAAPRLLLVAVETSEPGNAGTLIRIADAMGADAVVLAGDSVDPYNGKCLRASAGSIFAVPVLQAPDVEELMAALRHAGVRTLATTLDGEQSLAGMELTAATAWLFGSEAHGLAPNVAALADARVSIPMRGSAESLNIATAAAICLYQSALAQSGT